MADIEKLRKNLAARNISSSFFETAAEAVEYLDGKLDKTTIGFGGSVTVGQIGLYDKLSRHNRTLWHAKGGDPREGSSAPVYIASLNGVAETGELINIDGTCNRVAATLYGAQHVIFVIGINKIAPDYDSALWRARNIAAPKNAQRLGKKTPCAARADKCYDCKSADRICKALVVLWEKPNAVSEMEVVIINEDLGY